ncbi:MAG: hypothetical protein KAS32_10790 [Candidatus Peribacteraceae bacterium]|nr:hypothetical protein [Candidatus Peribacteraceae bacterium]
MKKLAYGDGVVYVGLSTVEFSGLAGESYSNVPDGTDISLVAIKQKLDLVDAKVAELLELKQLSQQVVNKLDNIGI